MVELRPEFDDLVRFNLGDLEAPPVLRGSSELGVHELQLRSLTEEDLQGLHAAPLFAEEPLEQIRRADRSPMRWRTVQVGT